MIPLATENPLLPAWAEIIAGLVFAGILWFLISRYVTPRFEATYAARAEAIQGGIEKAEHAQAEAQAALEEYRRQLADARGEAARIREDAKNQGAQIVTEMRAQAQAESERIITHAQTQMEAERNQVVTQLRAELGGLATDLAGRIVGESLSDDERARRTVDRFLAELEREPESTRP